MGGGSTRLRTWPRRERGFSFAQAVARCSHARPDHRLCLLAIPALADVAGVASVIDAPESCRSSPLLRLLRLCYAPQA